MVHDVGGLEPLGHRGIQPSNLAGRLFHLSHHAAEELGNGVGQLGRGVVAQQEGLHFGDGVRPLADGFTDNLIAGYDLFGDLRGLGTDCHC